MNGHSQSKKGSRGPGQPLRRGDACLMCRAKKLKCSASKPVCDQCAKRKDRCVYDAVRPASRVEKLEKKLAEMETPPPSGMHRQHQHPRGRSGDSLSLDSRHDENLDINRRASHPLGHSYVPPAAMSPWLNGDMGSGNNMAQMGQFDYSRMFPFATSNTTPSSSSNTPVIHPTLPTNGHGLATSDVRAETAPTSALHSSTWPVTGLPNGNADVSMTGTSLNQPPPTLEGMPWSLLSSSNDVSTVWSMDPMSNGQMNTMDTTDAGAGLGFNLDPMMGLNLTQTLPNNDNHSVMPLINSAPKDIKSGIDDVLTAAEKNVLKESDISQTARDYLLDLFFCPPRVAFGSEVWSEEQFRAKIALPPKDQPHPCLLFSMYTLAASSSYVPAVRSLAESLYSIALVKLDEAVAGTDRLLDAINTCKGLGKWQYQRARPLEGFTLLNKATMLSFACNLHQIKSSVFRIEEQRGRAAEAQWPLLGPPKDQWELAERIHAFWSCWANDRGAANTSSYPNFIPDQIITTPLPLPPESYLNGSLENHRDYTLRDLYLLSTRDDLSPPNYVYALLCASLHLNQRAKALRDMPPEGNSTYTALALASDPTNPEAMSETLPPCPRRDHPAAYKEIMEATYAIERKMGDATKIFPDRTPPWESIDAPLIHSCLNSARILLHSLDADAFDRDAVIHNAREMASLVKLWSKELKKEDGSSKWGKGAIVSTRQQNGIGGPYVLTGWFRAADRLIRATRILKGLGREQESKAVYEDANVIIEALRKLGMVYQQSRESTDSGRLSNGDLGVDLPGEYMGVKGRS